MNKTKLIVITTILIDVLGIGIIIPLMPFFVKQFNSSPLAVTLLMATYALCSFLSAPLLGALSDKIGRKPVLVVSLLSSAIGWFVFASAHWLWMLFVAKVIDGLAAGNYSTATSALADIAKDDKERTANVGLAGALFGLGLIIGPALSGLLATISQTFPFYFVSILAFCNVIAAWLFFPETNKHIDRDKKIDWHPLKPLARAVKDTGLRGIYVVILFMSIGAMFMQAVFSMYMDRVWHFNVHQVAMLMTLVGVFIAFNQGYAIKTFWLKYFSEKHLRLVGLLVYSLALIGLTVNNLYLFYAVLVFSVTAQSVAGVTVSSQMMKEAGPHRRGEVVGISASLQSLAAIVGPIGAGLAFHWHSSLAFYFGAFFVLIAFILELKTSKHA